MQKLGGSKDDVKRVEKKVPCSECGKLVGDTACDIKRHMESAHAPNHKLKYKCDICFKGFALIHIFVFIKR